MSSFSGNNGITKPTLSLLECVQPKNQPPRPTGRQVQKVKIAALGHRLLTSSNIFIKINYADVGDDDVKNLRLVKIHYHNSTVRAPCAHLSTKKEKKKRLSSHHVFFAEQPKHLVETPQPLKFLDS